MKCAEPRGKNSVHVCVPQTGIRFSKPEKFVFTWEIKSSASAGAKRSPPRGRTARILYFVTLAVRAILKPGKARVMSSNAQWTRSSAVEHYVDIVGVTGSIPVVSTIQIKGLGSN